MRASGNEVTYEIVLEGELGFQQLKCAGMSRLNREHKQGAKRY